MYDSQVTTATVRDLRTRFPRVRRMLEHDQEVVITDHGRPVAVLKPVEHVKTPAVPVDYYARLKRRMPRALGKAKSRALHEADRDER